MARKKLNFQVNPLLSGPTLLSRASAGSPYREIAISEIDVDPDQPRRVFSEDSLKELADSIREHGLLSPVLVVPQDGGTYRLIAGERRFRACKLAGLESIPALVDGDANGSSKLAKQLVENLQRENLTSMERAIAIGQLRDQQKWSIREIAAKIGVSKGFVQRSLEILELPEDLQAALINGESESKVLVLATVPNRDVRAQFLSQLEYFTRDQLEAEVKRVSALLEQGGEMYHGGTPQKGKKRARKLSAEDEQLVRELQSQLGTRVHLFRKRGKSEQGRLTIEFYSNQDLNDVFSRIVK